MAILNIEIDKLKKTIKKKKYLQAVNILKKSVETRTITKCILDLGVNLTISKLQVSASTIAK